MNSVEPPHREPARYSAAAAPTAPLDLRALAANREGPVGAHRVRRRWGGRRLRVALIVAVVAVLAGGTAMAAHAVLGGGRPALQLTVAQVAIGDSYYLTATGFDPGEAVELTWTGPTDGVMDARPADAGGTRRHGPIVERDPPGHYLIRATGQSSRRVAEAPLDVLP